MTNGLAMYGAGVTGRAVYRILSERGASPTAVYDSNPRLWGREFQGNLTISSPKDLSEFEGTLVVACAGGRALRDSLASVGVYQLDYSTNWEYQWKQIVTPLLDAEFSTTLARLKKSLSDDKSRQVLEFVLRNPRPQSKTIESLDVCEDYFSLTDTKELESLDVLVLGAHSGEEIRALSKRASLPKSLTLVEPDIEACDQLRNTVERHELDEIATVVQAAIGSQPGFGVLFGDGPSRRVSRENNENSEIIGSELRTIDSFGFDMSPNKGFITMDIEGYEVEALEGAPKTIDSGNVSWAISAYHKPHDLYRIFELFEQSSTDYDYQLRLLDFGIVDLTFFAFPKKFRT